MPGFAVTEKKEFYGRQVLKMDVSIDFGGKYESGKKSVCGKETGLRGEGKRTGRRTAVLSVSERYSGSQSTDPL